MTVSYNRSGFFAVLVLGLIVGASHASAGDKFLAPLFAAPGGIAAASNASGTASTSAVLTKDGAEICTSFDGRQQVVRSFGTDKAFYLSVGPARGSKPVIKDKHTYKKSAAGVAKKNAIDFDMFELIAETFGGLARPKDQWKATYQELYQGDVTVSDELGKVVGTAPMSCDAVSIDFK